MFILVRAVIYATLFISLLLVFLPGQVLEWSGVTRPAELGLPGIAGLGLGALGAAIALWCILTFAFVGKGTPAPFDPPRQLVVRGPYRFVRNPMYLGAGLALSGAALVYRSLALLGYVVALLVITHAFVVLYEEPTLMRLFGRSYDEYRATVRRWIPRL